LRYCRADTDGLAALFRKMEPHLQWPQAVARGRYTTALARVEAAGVPLDRRLYPQLREHHQAIRRLLIEEEGGRYGIFEDGTFSQDRFAEYLAGQGIAWPLTPTGLLSTAEDTFEDMLGEHPQLRQLHELRSGLGQLKEDGGLAVGRDGRNRTSLRPFATS